MMFYYLTNLSENSLQNNRKSKSKKRNYIAVIPSINFY
ncbi:hypothetical protein PHEL85_2797 [Polaribacter sp. Hel1_85]|nr:hypothetical protein PHEL85_2797 [Polaribacter sp. Hel1_85]